LQTANHLQARKEEFASDHGPTRPGRQTHVRPHRELVKPWLQKLAAICAGISQTSKTSLLLSQLPHACSCIHDAEDVGLGIAMSVAEGSPDPTFRKLPFRDAGSLSCSTGLGHFIDTLRAPWLWLIVAAPFTGFLSWRRWSWMAIAMVNLKPGLPSPISYPLQIPVFLNLDNILMLLAGTSIAVAWQRLMIPNEQPGFEGSNEVTKNVWRDSVVAAAPFLIVLLPAVPARLV
jgi:hypothetical protein